MECSTKNGTSVSPPLPEALELVLEMEKEESSELDVREKNQSEAVSSRHDRACS